MKDKSSCSLNELLDDNSIKVPLENLPNHVNSYFANIGPILARKFGDNTPIPLFDDRLHSNTHEFELTPVTSLDLFKIIDQIDIYKSSGIRDINSRILKDAMLVMLEEFTYLFNVSIKTGKIPQDWKVATVIPIPKVPNPKFATDLRPISLLPLPGKLLVKFVHKDLLQFLDKENILSDRQFGFCPSLSTSDAITSLIDDMGHNINNKMLC